MPKTKTTTGSGDGNKKNAAAVALGRLGGLKGGKARAAKLSPKERLHIAKLGVKARLENARQRKLLGKEKAPSKAAKK